MSVLGPCVPFDRARPLTEASDVDDAQSAPATTGQRGRRSGGRAEG
jgi:hypothetical protein